jgi:hypothetical protein
MMMAWGVRGRGTCRVLLSAVLAGAGSIACISLEEERRRGRRKDSGGLDATNACEVEMQAYCSN